MELCTITRTLDENENFLKNKIGQSFDINYRRFTISTCNDRGALLVYINGLVDTKSINNYILKYMFILQTP